MKFGATTNIVVVQYDPNDTRRSRPEIGKIDNGFGRFKVINHIEIPKSDMQYDVAVQTVIRLNEKYDPFTIRADRGAGEYQIEMLRKHIGEKVQGVFYGEKKEVRDPISGVVEKKSLKPLLINQMALLLERGQLRIPNSEISEIIFRQMINFRVVKVSGTTKEPIYTSDDEHGLDAFIFAMTGFFDEYPNLVDIIEEFHVTTDIGITKSPRQRDAMDNINRQLSKGFKEKDLPDDKQPRYQKVSLGFSKRKNNTSLNSRGWDSKTSDKGLWRNKRF